MTAGLRAAQARGFTHALQIDADGQGHALGDVGRFLAEASAHPDQMVCGRPVFDEAMPEGRFYGRYLTHVFGYAGSTRCRSILRTACAVSASIRCAGARAAPIAQRLGSRMDFDVEVLVRLHWRGLRMRWLPTRVSYPLDGVLALPDGGDNVLMVRLQLKLFLGMLVRLPLLLWRKVS